MNLEKAGVHLRRLTRETDTSGQPSGPILHAPGFRSQSDTYESKLTPDCCQNGGTTLESKLTITESQTDF